MLIDEAGTGHKYLTDTRGTSKPPFHGRLGPRIVAAVLLLLAVLLIDLTPAVPAPAPPTGTQAARSRDVYRSVRDSLAGRRGPVMVHIDVADLKNATALASRLDRIGRFAAGIEGEELRFWVSRRLLGPFWLNVRADVPPSRAGFPPVSLHIGRLPLGETISRWVIDAGLAALRARGVRTPPLDQAVRSLRVGPDGVTALVDLPLGSGVLSRLPQLRVGPIDSVAAARVLCGLIAAEREEPADDFGQVVRRAYAIGAGDDAVESNRARLVAIALYTAGPPAARLATDVQARAKACGAPAHSPTLIGREDLAKHWSLSAALAVTAGDDVSRALGEWKELADSRPKGEGFSFVDLSADRSGIAVGRRAVDPDAAAALARRMASVTDHGLLPVKALALSEGLSEAQFVARYGNVDSPEFAAAIARIDAVIANTVGV